MCKLSMLLQVDDRLLEAVKADLISRVHKREDYCWLSQMVSTVTTRASTVGLKMDCDIKRLLHDALIKIKISFDTTAANPEIKLTPDVVLAKCGQPLGRRNKKRKVLLEADDAGANGSDSEYDDKANSSSDNET
jgi:hypothetical protein